MARQIDADKGQAALGDGASKHTGACKCRIRDVVVIGDVEGVGGRGLEALEAAPGHVLDLEQGAICDAVGYIKLVFKSFCMRKWAPEGRHWDREKEKVVVQNHVQSSVADDDVLCAVNNTRKDSGRGGERGVVAVNKDVDI